ncbi:DeoR family transcriptional regulator, fructose operon transcriptional repressor [Sinosporangium album]|uniref:DeoR family transcriptional regulator, fructose operon transcriptional repressor n=1 Tax=Sinosporangium album TaxID=504805 RepID=A0A1G7S6V5_9ACTN|nr:DeoR/GlpR family DNA-binding transcription regulator [Sinosporangium album]SDG18721.1 DeoR family transcriptional regulator, fructose operon transcriptional repressor [Sinosporangium album]
MLSEKRRSTLLSHVRTNGSVSVDDLADLLGVSVSTVRRDLDEMDERGLLRRVHGGAIALPNAESSEVSLVERAIRNLSEKSRIAARAVDQIKPHSTVLLTGGSTCAQMVPHLGRVRDLTVVTNSVAIAHAIGTSGDQVQVLVLGGLMRNTELSLLGHLTTQALADIHIDTAFFSAFGLDPEYGMLGAHLAEAETDRNMITVARDLVVLADHTKFSQSSAVRIAPVSRIGTVITDDATSDGAVNRLRAQDVTVIIA